MFGGRSNQFAPGFESNDLPPQAIMLEVDTTLSGNTDSATIKLPLQQPGFGEFSNVRIAWDNSVEFPLEDSLSILPDTAAMFEGGSWSFAPEIIADNFFNQPRSRILTDAGLSINGKSIVIENMAEPAGNIFNSNAYYIKETFIEEDNRGDPFGWVYELYNDSDFTEPVLDLNAPFGTGLGDNFTLVYSFEYASIDSATVDEIVIVSPNIVGAAPREFEMKYDTTRLELSNDADSIVGRQLMKDGDFMMITNIGNLIEFGLIDMPVYVIIDPVQDDISHLYLFQDPELTVPVDPFFGRAGNVLLEQVDIVFTDQTVTVEDYNLQFGDELPTHSFLRPGTHKIFVAPISDTLDDPNGVFGFETPDTNLDRQKLTKVLNWGKDNKPTKLEFRGSTNLDVVATNTPDLSALTSIAEMFRDCTSLIGNEWFDRWDTSTITNTERMFEGAILFDQPIGSWDMSSVVDIDNMFLKAQSFNKNIESWDTSSVTTMAGVFSQALAFNQPLNNWNVSNVTNMQFMFGGSVAFSRPGAESFNQPLDNWDVSNVSNMRNMFFGALDFNQDISGWTINSTVFQNEMEYMFGNAESFNQNLSNWCVEQIPSEPTGFDDGATAWTLPKPNWGAPC